MLPSESCDLGEEKAHKYNYYQFGKHGVSINMSKIVLRGEEKAGSGSLAARAVPGL